MSQQKISMGQWIFLAVLLVVIGSVGITVYSNNQANQRQSEAVEAEKKRVEAEKLEQSSQEHANDMRRSFCLADAQKRYEDDWAADVKYLGRTDGRLPEPYSSDHEQRLSAAKDECYRQHSD